MDYLLFLTPFICALVGWAVHAIAAQVLLNSSKTKKVLAQKLGTMAATEIASINLEDKIGDPANFQKLVPLIESHVDDFLRNKLKEQMPMISMFIGDKTITTMKHVFMKELENLFPQVMRQFASNMKNDPNIAHMVSSRVEAITTGQLKKMLAVPLRAAGWLGAITGFIVGWVQLCLILALAYFN
jgi:hypothetical protein